jgi:hypothetical protein
VTSSARDQDGPCVLDYLSSPISRAVLPSSLSHQLLSCEAFSSLCFAFDDHHSLSHFLFPSLVFDHVDLTFLFSFSSTLPSWSFMVVRLVDGKKYHHFLFVLFCGLGTDAMQALARLTSGQHPLPWNGPSQPRSILFHGMVHQPRSHPLPWNGPSQSRSHPLPWNGPSVQVTILFHGMVHPSHSGIGHSLLGLIGIDFGIDPSSCRTLAPSQFFIDHHRLHHRSSSTTSLIIIDHFIDQHQSSIIQSTSIIINM